MDVYLCPAHVRAQARPLQWVKTSPLTSEIYPSAIVPSKTNRRL